MFGRATISRWILQLDEPGGNRRPQRRVVLIVAGCVVALDAISKALAVHLLTGRGTISVLAGAVHLERHPVCCWAAGSEISSIGCCVPLVRCGAE